MVNLLDKLEDHWLDLISPFGIYDLGGGFAVSCSDLDLIQVNHVTHINIDTKIQVNEDEVDLFIRRAEDFFSSKNTPLAFRVTPTTRPGRFDRYLLEKGFGGPFNASVMIYKGEEITSSANPEIVVKSYSAERISLYLNLWHKISGIPQSQRGLWDNFFTTILTSRGSIYLGYIGDLLVGGCLLVSAAEVNGLYMVGTSKEFRSRGVASTLCARAINDSLDAGYRMITLQTNEGSYAERFFQKLGFQKEYTMSFYQEKASESK